jgi:hypothetical protein
MFAESFTLLVVRQIFQEEKRMMPIVARKVGVMRGMSVISLQKLASQVFS